MGETDGEHAPWADFEDDPMKKVSDEESQDLGPVELGNPTGFHGPTKTEALWLCSWKTSSYSKPFDHLTGASPGKHSRPRITRRERILDVRGLALLRRLH